MRGAARGLIAALLLVLATAGAAGAQPAYFRAIRSLDGAQFVEDEPIWICDENEPTDADARAYRLVGIEDGGGRVRYDATLPLDSLGLAKRARAKQFTSLFQLPERPDLHPLMRTVGLRAGAYEVRRSDVDTSKALARFRVVEPRGSEVAVRAALARFSRLAEQQGMAYREEGTELVEAILRRYPNTSYRTVAYLYLWSGRDLADTPRDTGGWIDELFAHFHDSCFGVWALDGFMRRRAEFHEFPGSESDPVRRHLRRAAALYPDTRLARAAARYL